MKNTQNKNNSWGLKKDLEQLPPSHRKDALVLLYFLNEHIEQQKAFKELKEFWVNNLYKLPETSSEKYNSIKNGRYKVLSRLKRLHDKYMVKL